ncbi:2'-5' RNA ligase family protein [Sphingomonas sp.]|uniref:2'-5' RNA ligase family protein n=1 Tax=Sphingomonas sp. TaxID=28214 RepID=UPI0017E49FD7|nr:2'-5' RNA ligase family protein [Sphingomonas sp.]MBA3511350.1 2'-5' RNA ligase family protein [Sphingomonas sp.]
MAGALIVTAELGSEDFAWLDALRRRHYPPERNRVPAHLTMFHALAPSAEDEVRGRLAGHSAGPAPPARIAGVMDLGGGVAFRVVSDELEALRDELADDLHGLLGAQDSRGWKPHVTIQNKVAPKVARQLLYSLEREFRPRPLRIAGLGLHRYLAGPWETLGVWKFRG